MQNQDLRQLADYLDIVAQVDRTIYFRCRTVTDIHALAKGLATMLPGTVRTFIHRGHPLQPDEEDRMVDPLMAGETVLLIYPGETASPLQFAQEWDSFQFNPTPTIEKPGFLAIVQIFDNEEPIPYEGSTRWIFEEEVKSIEKIGKDLNLDIIQI